MYTLTLYYANNILRSTTVIVLKVLYIKYVIHFTKNNMKNRKKLVTLFDVHEISY